MVQSPVVGKELQDLLETLDPGDTIQVADASRAKVVEQGDFVKQYSMPSFVWGYSRGLRKGCSCGVECSMRWS